MVARRRELARRYRELLADIPGLVTIVDPEYGTTNFQSFWVLLPEDFPVTRDGLMEQLAANGVSARRGIMAAHAEPAYAGMSHVALPVTERLTANSLVLPLYHQLSEEDQDHVVSVVRAAASSRQMARTPS
jgi:perosamine synthetase